MVRSAYGNSKACEHGQAKSVKKDSEKLTDESWKRIWWLHVTVVPDKKECGLCGVKETDPDPCFSNKTMLWYEIKKVMKNGAELHENKGGICFYCKKTHRANYYPKHTIDGLVRTTGQDMQAKEQDTCFELV